MSRPYRITVQKVVEQEISADDRAVLRLKLEPILPQAELDELLTEALERHGWSPTESGRYEKAGEQGETLTADVAAREIIAEVAIERTVRNVAQREITGDTWNWRQMREMTAEELEQRRQQEEDRLAAEIPSQQAAEAAAQLRQEAADRLAAGADSRREQVNRLVIEVTSAAVKRKAAELGQVERIEEHWDGDEYELTISIGE